MQRRNRAGGRSGSRGETSSPIPGDGPRSARNRKRGSKQGGGHDKKRVKEESWSRVEEESSSGAEGIPRFRFPPSPSLDSLPTFSQQLSELVHQVHQKQALLEQIPGEAEAIISPEQVEGVEEEDWQSVEDQEEDEEALDSEDPSSRNNRRGRNRRQKKGGEEAEEVAEEIPVQSAFWAHMEEYFRPLSEADFALLSVQAPNPADPAFEIPALGIDQQQDEDDYEPNAKKKHRTRSRTDRHPKVAEDDLFIGEFTQRVLSLLLAEGTAAPVAELVKPAKEETLDENDPPIDDYTQDNYINFEERVRMELRALGLLEADVVYIPPQDRQDDEIAAELRQLQMQLRREIESNNKKRQHFAHIVQQKQQQQELEKKMLVEAKKIEQQYKAMLRKKRNRNK